MCGRYTLTRQDGVVEEMEATLSIEGAPPETQAWWKPRFNVAPTQPAPVVVQREGVRTIELFRWGLVPHWATKPEPGGTRAPLMINARVETIMQKPVFKRAFERRRVLVPADGFFEWKRSQSGTKTKPQPLYIRPVPRRLVAFAGIAVRAGDLRSFAILTGPPNALVAPIHDRMPIVLDRAAYRAWLDPGLSATDALGLLHVPPIDDWQADFVSTAVNKAANDDPSCVELVTLDEPTQGSLF